MFRLTSMKTILLLFTVLLSAQALAHPVIYQDGWAINSSNMPSYSNNYASYSFTNRLSLGLEHWRFTRQDDNTEAGFVKLNHLLWRKNGEDSQANIYLHGGAGVVDQEWNERATKGIGLLGAEVDWETRTLYTSLKHLEFHAPRGLDLAMTQARVGISPIIADFKSLQTWFMLQGMVIRGVEDKLMLTPMLRFFYNNVLWEIGASTRGDWMLNLMVHY